MRSIEAERFVDRVFNRDCLIECLLLFFVRSVDEEFVFFNSFPLAAIFIERFLVSNDLINERDVNVLKDTFSRS